MAKIEIHFQKKQSEFDLAIDEHKLTFYGGARGGGKSHALRNIMLKRRMQYGKTIGAIFRRTYQDLEANHIRPLLQEHPVLAKYYNRQAKVLELPNGSELWFCYCDHENDLLRYQGREFHDLSIDEIGQWEEGWFQTLRGSNRCSLSGYKARILLTGNPGGIGHKWLKRLFVDRDFNERETAEDYAFIKATVYDNDALMDNDPDYLRNLLAEPNEALRRAFLEGDWSIFAGQYFSDFRRDAHVLPASFKIEEWWQRFGGYDHGYFHPYLFGAFASDGDGNVYLYKEIGGRGRTLSQIADEIHAGCPEVKDMTIWAGHDCWSVQRDGGPTIHEQFSQMGPKRLNIVKADISRISGATQLRSYLAHDSNKRPRFYILENCRHTIECLPRMIHDPNRPEDVLKVDATEIDEWAGDEGYDVVRYALMSRPSLSKEKAAVYPHGTYGWLRTRQQELKQAQSNAKLRS